MATSPQGRYAYFGPGEHGDPDNAFTWDYYGFSDTWAPGMQSTEGWAPGYYTDNSGTFDQFFERAVLGGLAAIAGGAAAEIYGGASGGATGFEVYDPIPPDVGRPSPIAQSSVRLATAAAVSAGLPAPLARLIGRTAMDDDYGFNDDGGFDIEEAAGGIIRDYGGSLPSILGGGGGGQVMQTGMMGGAVMAGAGLAARSLWSVLRAGGARFSTFIGQNGVKAKLADLWPAVRQYGPTAVATALGIGLAELGQLLVQAPTTRRRKRGRGISAADIRRAKRVIRFNRRLSRELGTSSSRRSYRPRRRRYY